MDVLGQYLPPEPPDRGVLDERTEPYGAGQGPASLPVQHYYRLQHGGSCLLVRCQGEHHRIDEG